MERCQSPIANRQSLFRSGQSLIEVMVAITLLTVGFLGITSLLSQSLALNRVVANQLTATYLASEGVEVAKNLIDHDFYAQQIDGQGDGWGSCFGSGGDFELAYDTPDCSSLTEFVGAGDPLYYHPDTHLYDYDSNGGTETNFTRDIRVQRNSTGPSDTTGDEITVKAIVSWPGLAGAGESVTLEDHFYKWY
jgi:hypothetical protein